MLLALGVKNNKTLAILISLVSLICLSIFNLNGANFREDWRSVAAWINSDPGVVIFPNDAQSTPLKYYHLKFTTVDSPVYLMRYVQEIFDPKDLKKTQLEQAGYNKVTEKGFNGVLIWKYQR